MHTFLPSWSSQYDRILISSITLLLLFLIAFKGAGAFARVNLLIFSGLLVSLAVGIGTLYLSQQPSPLLNHLVTADCPVGSSPPSPSCQLNADRVMREELSLPARNQSHAVLANVSGAFYPWAWSAPCPQRQPTEGRVVLACGSNGR